MPGKNWLNDDAQPESIRDLSANRGPNATRPNLGTNIRVLTGNEAEPIRHIMSHGFRQ